MDTREHYGLNGASPVDESAADPIASFSHDEIAAEAYSMFEDRGREDGRDLDDWISAESRLRERRSGLRDLGL
jgi:hypothetical protein